MARAALSEPSEREQLLPASRINGGHGYGVDNQGRLQDSHQHARQLDRHCASYEEGITAHGILPKLGASMLNFFVSGCAMAGVGALIADIERHYQTSNGVTAFLFPAGVLGYVVATASVEPTFRRSGRRGIAILSSTTRLLAALLLAAEPQFGILLIAYVCFGFGTGLTDTAWNAWASNMRRANVLQGLLHGSFSVGCICGPIIALAILREHSWSYFYLVVALLSSIELLAQGWAFRHETAPAIPPTTPDTEADSAPVKPSSLLQRPSLWTCGIFYFLYQGVEATFTGWIVVFMLRVRNADSIAASLASSVFWAGMAVGRYGLGFVTERFGVAPSVAAYIACAITLQVVLNLVRDTASTLVFLAFNGMFIAPLFPSGIVLLVSRLEEQDHMHAVAYLIAIGQVGGALATLAVGFMADSIGIRHLFEVMCGLSTLMLLTWSVLVRLR